MDDERFKEYLRARRKLNYLWEGAGALVLGGFITSATSTPTLPLAVAFIAGRMLRGGHTNRGEAAGYIFTGLGVLIAGFELYSGFSIFQGEDASFGGIMLGSLAVGLAAGYLAPSTGDPK